MNLKNCLFTSESVTEGHPDKIADQISDAVLDAVFEGDPYGRVACETLLTTGLIVVAGEITSKVSLDFGKIARQTMTDIGYTRAKFGFDAETCAVISSVKAQSPDISQGVTEGEGLHSEQGAGDQGMMFGYACNDTEELMPMPIMLAHKLCLKLAEVRRDGTLPYLRPDGKSQVSVEYRNGNPVRVDTVVISSQHSADYNLTQIRGDVIEQVIEKIIPPELLDHKRITYHVNPTGRFVVGGPMGDAGLTGRKIIVDTYGGMGTHGGGAFSGKDPSKVDRSASYMARYVAKNVVAAGLSNRCQVQLAYAIGVADPVSVMVDTFGTGKIPEEQISEIARANFNLKPRGIIESLDLRRPFYRKTASYGHFGRNDPDFTWERTDKAEALRRDAGL